LEAEADYPLSRLSLQQLFAFQKIYVANPGTIIRVQATAEGVYGNALRQIGDVFDIQLAYYAPQATNYLAGVIGQPLFGWMITVSPNTPITMNSPQPLVTPAFNGTGTNTNTLALTNKPRTVL
jgi:hypothetical protein